MKRNSIRAQKYRIIFISIWIVMCGLIFTLKGQSEFEVLNENYSKESIFAFDNRYSGVKGSPYLFNDWLPAKVEVRHANQDQSYVVDNISAKFNIYDNTLYVKPQRGSSVVVMDKGIKAVTFLIGPDSLTIFPLTIKAKEVFGSTISDNPIQVTKTYARSFREADYKGGYSDGRTYDEFINKDQWVINRNGDWIVVKNSKKFWTKLFPGQKGEITQFFRSNSLTDDQMLDQLLSKLNQ